MEGVADDRRGDLGVRSRWVRDGGDALFHQQFTGGSEAVCACRPELLGGFENGCHWTLDTTFHEGESRIRDARMRENFAWRNRFVLSLLKQHLGKDSLIGKRRGRGWYDDSLLEVLAGTGR